MTRRTVVVIRDGEIKMRVPITQHVDGTLWATSSRGESPLLDGKAPGAPANLADLTRAGKYNQIPAACFACLGTNASGLLVQWADEYDAAHRAPVPELTAAQRARRNVDSLYAAADHAEHASYYDPQRIIMARAAADAALMQWRATYPAEAKSEQRDHLLAQAEHEESIAVGALTYDADGWLGQAERQRRHDDYMAKAADLRRQADSL